MLKQRGVDMGSSGRRIGTFLLQNHVLYKGTMKVQYHQENVFLFVDLSVENRLKI